MYISCILVNKFNGKQGSHLAWRGGLRAQAKKSPQPAIASFIASGMHKIIRADCLKTSGSSRSNRSRSVGYIYGGGPPHVFGSGPLGGNADLAVWGTQLELMGRAHSAAR